MAKFTVYHTARTEMPPVEHEILSAIDADIRLIAPGKSPAELASLMPDADGVFVVYAPITAEVLDGMPNCKVVVRYGVGVDTLDLDAATERGVICAHVPDVHRREVANHALMLMLAVTRKLIRQDRAIRAGGWTIDGLAPTPELYGQTLGLVACGPIARLMAERGRALSMRVVGYDPYEDPARVAAAGIELQPSLEAVLSQSDVVSVHAPHTPETEHMIDAAALARMKPSAYLLNTARGPVIDEAALIAALQSGAIAGAGLDVFEQEPMTADNPLRSMDNVVLTPHTAYYSDHASATIIRRAAESMAHVLTGHWPRFVANKGVLGKLDLKPCPDPPDDP